MALPFSPEFAEAQPRLFRQLEFIAAVDALKTVERRTRILDGTRRENSAEHSWHLALSAMLLAEHAPPGTNPGRAIAMLLIHDCIEVHAGDTFAYDDAACAGQHEREELAACRIFGILPEGQSELIRGLWDEFETAETPTAKFAVALDRMHPLIQNATNNGGTWREYNVSEQAVRSRMEPIRTGLPAAWPMVEALIRENIALGHITTVC